MSLNYSRKELTKLIKEKAYKLGFSAVGIAKAESISHDSIYFKNWINNGFHADMAYLNNHYDKRINPELLVPGTKSIICVALNYFPKTFIPEDEYQISWYAYGKDYHIIMKDKLKQLFDYISEIQTTEGRLFCDTAPVLERYWAWKAGLGWIGKNTQLIIPKAGSTFFLGELFIDIDLEYDTPQENRCGKCTKCLEACPTKALTSPYILNSNRCLSYLTIENRNDIPEKYIEKMNNKIYGCDDCLKVCPWTRFAKPTMIEEFNASTALLEMNKSQWNNLKLEEYQILFKKSAVKRAKFNGLTRNIEAAKLND